MHVERAHEDAHLQAFVVEMVVLFRGFDHHHLAVAGRDDKIRVVNLQHTYRVAEEVGHKHQQRCRQDQRHGKHPARFVDKNRYVDSEQQETQRDDDVASLLVYFQSFSLGHTFQFSKGIFSSMSAALSSAS